jgi:hypothetical protein
MYWWMWSELERIWKEVVPAYFKALLQNLPGGTKWNQKTTLVMLVSIRGQKWTSFLMNTSQKILALEPSDP